MKTDGFSLIELMTVIIIGGILATLGTVSYHGWRTKHDMEKQMRETYADLANLRVMAKAKSMSHFMSFAASQITAREDSNESAALDAGDATLCLWDRQTGQAADATCGNAQSVSAKALQYPIRWSGNATLRFDNRGLADQNDTICIDYSVTSQADASYDCIDVSTTRIALGSLTNKSGVCSSANCAKKR